MVRLVCAGWQAIHDALVTRLLLRKETTDEAMGMLARRFPAVTSVRFKRRGGFNEVVTDEGVRAVSSMPALTALNINGCKLVTDEGVLAVRQSAVYLDCGRSTSASAPS